MTNFTTYDNDWISYEQNDGNLIWTINDSILETTPDVLDFTMLKSKMLDAVKRIEYGNNAFVSLSGGVDSQAVCLLLKQANIKFRAAILQFNDNLNVEDVSSALAFCRKHNIEYVLIDLNIMNFLARQLDEYVQRYQCPSPHFTAHFWFYEKLIEQFNPSIIICGGHTPRFENGKWQYHTTRARNAWTTFNSVNKPILLGNFLSWSYDIAFPVMMAIHTKDSSYESKVNGFKMLGLPITPQDKKYTGFENIKANLERMTGDGWSFEKMYRYPYQAIVPDYQGVLRASSEVLNKFSTLVLR